MCVITQGGKNYHNVGLFVRIEGSWKLLAWANEEVESPSCGHVFISPRDYANDRIPKTYSTVQIDQGSIQIHHRGILRD